MATSATIKSVDEAHKTRTEIHRLRNEAVQEFLSKLTGFEGARFLILGEEIEDRRVPREATWPESPGKDRLNGYRMNFLIQRDHLVAVVKN